MVSRVADYDIPAKVFYFMSILCKVIFVIHCEGAKRAK